MTALYCFAVAAPASIAYASVFMLFPGTGLADEAARWRRLLPVDRQAT